MVKKEVREEMKKIIRHIEFAMSGICKIGETLCSDDKLFETESWDFLDFVKTDLKNRYIKE